MWEVVEERGVVIVKVVKNPLKQLEGKYSDPNLTYEKVEELADRLVVGELRADN